jgi:uncharacterized protein (TIGR03067 family)
MRHLSVPALFAITVGSAFADAPKAADSGVADLKAVQGKWDVIRVVKNGTEVPAKELTRGKAQLKVKDSIAEFLEDGVVQDRVQITLNSSAHPKHIDLLRVDERGKPLKVKKLKPSAKGRPEVIGETDVSPARGLFELKDDRLTICISEGEGDDRPGGMDEWQKSKKVMLMVLQRAKE